MLNSLKGTFSLGGRASWVIYEDHSIFSLLTAERAMAPNIVASRATIKSEKIPPVKVLKSGSSWYLMSCVVEKKSA